VDGDRTEGAVMEWQPIETAPKDDTQILLTDGSEVSQGWWEPDYGWLGWEVYRAVHRFTPTHWMPLPDPPASPRKTGS